MALIVQKYGGTSVADPDRIRAVADNVAFTKKRGNDVIVVVSAMGKATDNLIALANSVSTTQSGREMDMLLTTGERQTAALMTMALADRGIEAISFTGSQVGIITDTDAPQGEDRRGQGRPGPRVARGRQGRVIAGFQGVSTDKEITTMGRGASDLTASALAQAMSADACEIYTDVTGVFTADPRIVPQARKLAKVHFDEMLEMAGAGSKVLALRSVEFARNHDVPLHVRSAFTWEPGTWVTNEEPSMEDPIISGVVTDMSEAKVTVFGVPDRPGISAALFEPLADANVNVDMIVQNTSTRGHDRHQLHDADGRHGRGRGDRAAGRRRDRRHRRVARQRHRQGVARRCRHEVVAGHRREDVPDPRRRGRQHPDDLDVDDPGLGHLRRRRHGAAARALHTAFGLDSGADYSAPLPERR